MVDLSELPPFRALVKVHPACRTLRATRRQCPEAAGKSVMDVLMESGLAVLKNTQAVIALVRGGPIATGHDECI